jgi:hypothetical protein
MSCFPYVNGFIISTVKKFLGRGAPQGASLNFFRHIQTIPVAVASKRCEQKKRSQDHGRRGECVGNRREKLLAEYVIQHRESHYRLAYSFLKNQEDALDVVQESIYKLGENTRDFSHGMNRSTVFGQSHD